MRVRVTGRVQGVSFRAHAAHEAVRLEVRGWVRNEPDGSVLAHVEGPDRAVEEMVARLRHGPDAARVEDAVVEPAEVDGVDSFEVDY